MLFRFHRDRDNLQRALRAAVAARHPDVLSDLLERQGEVRVAKGLLILAAPGLAEALSMLPPERPANYRDARSMVPPRPLLGLLVCGGQP